MRGDVSLALSLSDSPTSLTPQARGCVAGGLGGVREAGVDPA